MRRYRFQVHFHPAHRPVPDQVGWLFPVAANLSNWEAQQAAAWQARERAEAEGRICFLDLLTKGDGAKVWHIHKGRLPQ
jgi:hypothetical protein